MNVIKEIIAEIKAIRDRIEKEIGFEHLTGLQASQLLEGAEGELSRHPDAQPPVIQTEPPATAASPTTGGSGMPPRAI